MTEAEGAGSNALRGRSGVDAGERPRTNGEQIGHPRVEGKCPSCGGTTLFLGSGGYVTCSLIGCTDPCAAADVLERGARASSVHPLVYQLIAEMARQDEKHGSYQGTVLGRSRLALATLEDEIAEALEAWRSERKALSWDHTREEVLQVAAVAIRTLRDAL